MYSKELNLEFATFEQQRPLHRKRSSKTQHYSFTIFSFILFISINSNFDLATVPNLHSFEFRNARNSQAKMWLISTTLRFIFKFAIYKVILTPTQSTNIPSGYFKPYSKPTKVYSKVRVYKVTALKANLFSNWYSLESVLQCRCWFKVHSECDVTRPLRPLWPRCCCQAEWIDTN